MAASATIVSAWQDKASAYATAVVAEGGGAGTVEYVASTALVDNQGQPKSAAQIKSDLVAALSAARAAQLARPTPLAGVSGSVTL